MCTHEKTILMPCHRVVCEECGLITAHVLQPCKMQLYEDYSKECLIIPYTRLKRFRNLINSIVFGFETTMDRKMIHELKINKANSLRKIISVMNKSKLVDKRFASLHLFLRCFAPDRVNIKYEHIQRFRHKQTAVERLFNRIENVFNFEGRMCLNYKFILDVILHDFGFEEFRVFIKPMMCRKRIQKHIDNLNRYKIKRPDGTTFVVPETYVMSPKSLFLRQADRVESPSPKRVL